MSEKLVIIGRNALIPLGLVLSIVGAAVFFGMSYNRLGAVEQKVGSLENKTDQLSEAVARIEGKLGTTGITKR